MSFNDKLKQAVDKVDPDRIVAELKASVGELAREHGPKVDQAMAKVSARLDDRTQGKYADKLASARRKVNDGVAKAADLPPLEDEVERPDYRRTPPAQLSPHDFADAPPDPLPDDLPPEHRPS
ncbi:antitoxin [Nocardioides oleivorans]|uniref:Antitoxin n=1 Tax=Nocardioides oleivorans TaxID=273676 RepID=A0A4Q2RYQ5_9ACTN|nr:antitoxin [Nocardioides oleivorans]RYB93956.1 antitoxin [Nocardioides oleivorans]